MRQALDFVTEVHVKGAQNRRLFFLQRGIAMYILGRESGGWGRGTMTQGGVPE